MRRINRLMFWFGGVLAPRVSNIIEDLLESRGSSLSAPDRLSLRNLEKVLALGQVSQAEFCQVVCDLSSSVLSTADISARLESGLPVSRDLPPLLDELAECCPLFILSDFPHDWLFSSFQEYDFSKHFPESSIRFTRDYRAESYPSLLSTLVQSDILHPGTTLLVDSTPERVHLTVRSGIDVAIFVDARRLRRDLVLWDILDPLTSQYPGEDPGED